MGGNHYIKTSFLPYCALTYSVESDCPPLRLRWYSPVYILHVTKITKVWFYKGYWVIGFAVCISSWLRDTHCVDTTTWHSFNRTTRISRHQNVSVLDFIGAWWPLQL